MSNKSYFTQKIIELSQSNSNDEYTLIEFLSSDICYVGIDKNKNVVFVIESDNSNLSPSAIKTSLLELLFNVKSTLKINNNNKFKVVHILKCFSRNECDIDAFIRLCEAFAKNVAISYKAEEIKTFFATMINLFKVESGSNIIEYQGLFAELFTIRLLDSKGVNILSYWQSKDRMKFDFSFSNKKIEVKSTIKQQRIHHFKHEQLLSDIYDIIIASYILREDDMGLTLAELINDIRLIVNNEYKALVHLERIVRGISEEDLYNIRYDETYILKNLKFFKVQDIPRFNENQPRGVANAEYDSCLENLSCLSLDDVISWIRED